MFKDKKLTKGLGIIPEQYNKMGIEATMKGSYKKAIDKFKKSIKLNPTYSEALLNLGFISMLTGENEEAEQFFIRVLQINPDDKTAKNYLAIAKEGLKHIEDTPELRRTKHFQTASYSIRGGKLKVFLKDAEQALALVTEFLEEEFERTIFIEINPKFDFPITEFSDRPVHRKISLTSASHAGLVHEITHAVFFCNNRFLAEGLATFMQYRFSKDRKWPFPDLKLEESLLKFRDDLVPLDELIVETTDHLEIYNPGQLNSLTTRIAYAEAASFVELLIGKYGVDKFKALCMKLDKIKIPSCQAEGIKEVYNEPLKAIEKEWLKTLYDHIKDN
jgi:tetratricopeptide (TPR) repeat protein